NTSPAGASTGRAGADQSADEAKAPAMTSVRYFLVNNCAFTPPSVSTRSPYLRGQVMAPLATTIDCFPVLEVTTVCKHEFRSVASTI
ncbi:hypothetical protein, partial [Kocuria sp.]|uniref:hypothetical protein n=1 Tax=Kocuria sp. TaxID=1871328 RepID=UPI00289F590E